MDRPNLDELVGIWERWTQGDAVLRQAWESLDGQRTADRLLLDQALARLEVLVRRDAWRDSAASAALIAGWAVLLALEGEVEALGEQWHRLRYYALLTHQDALNERAAKSA
jgi:hypothetical protein